MGKRRTKRGPGFGVSRARQAFVMEKFLAKQRRCAYCCCQLVYNPIHNEFSENWPNRASVEHMIPRSTHKVEEPWNYLVVCIKCNSNRGATDFLDWIEENQFPRQNWLKTKYGEAVNRMKDYIHDNV